MATRQEKVDYINHQVSTRGYAQEYQKICVEHDYDMIVKANDLTQEILMKDRTLDRKTKELVFIAGLTLLRAPQWQIKQHIEVAVALGATKEMILEVIELTILGGGFVVFQHGLFAWTEVFGATGVEPTVEALDQFKAKVTK
jgi:4-carboxymuconolactone decarboxylase